MRSRFQVMSMMALAGLAAWSPAGAQTGKIFLDVHEAESQTKGDDSCAGPFCSEQDFWVQVMFPPFNSWLLSNDIGNRDHPAWPPFSNSEDVSKMQRYHDMRVELWDSDDNTADDRFDITPIPGETLDIHFDACTQTWEQIGTGQVHGPGRAYPPFGTQDPEYNGRVVIDVYTENRLPFTTNDISIAGLNPVQVAFDPKAVISDKATAMRIRIASTYTGATPQPAPVTVTVTDGVSVWTETRNLIIPGTDSGTGVTDFYFFDGMVSGSQPFFPHKPPNTDLAWITYSAHVDYNDVAPPGTAPDFIDCYQSNNSLDGKQTDLIRTQGPTIVFAPYEFMDAISGLPPFSAVLATAQTDEPFRKATWPLSQTPWLATAIPSLAPWNPLDPVTYFSEPYRELFFRSIAVGLLGIDRMVLVPRNGWFQDNSFRSGIWPSGSIGLSLGEFAPHVVVAEAGHIAVSTHELGHSWAQSQRKCSKDPGNAGCRDEYNGNYLPNDGAPFIARGLDVEGAIFANGSSGGAGCAPVQPGTREVCLNNIMNVQSDGGFVNWTDTFTFNDLIDRLRVGADPEMINLSGYVHSTNGLDPNVPPIFEGGLEFSYHSFGVPDFEDPLSGTPGTSHAPASGHGPFAVTLRTDAGDKIYRFMPEFFGEGESSPHDAAFFSFNVPWDPTTQSIRLFSPADMYDIDCEDGSCSQVLLFERMIQPGPPIVDALRAGRDVAPPLSGPALAPPTIGPGHEAVVAWHAIDPQPGAEGLRTVLMLSRVGPAGGPEQWMPYAISVTGSEMRIPHDWLAMAPGDFMGQVVVSNGLLSAPLTAGTLFHVCNYSNGGVEACNGIDDDCDGLVDNGGQPGPIQDVTLNPQPFPPAPPALQWPAEPAAQSYDVVYGDVATLGGTGGDFSQAILGCAVENTTGTSISVGPGPIQGQAFFYLVRGNNCIGAGTWNEINPGPISRDPGINASPAACRP